MLDPPEFHAWGSHTTVGRGPNVRSWPEPSLQVCPSGAGNRVQLQKPHPWEGHQSSSMAPQLAWLLAWVDGMEGWYFQTQPKFLEDGLVKICPFIKKTSALQSLGRDLGIAHITAVPEPAG